MNKIILFSVLLVISGCEFSDDTYSQKYSNHSLDILVPSNCENVFLKQLSDLNMVSGSDYTYRKFTSLPDAYRNISGYLTLHVSTKISMAKLNIIDMNLRNTCYANASFTYNNNIRGWEHFHRDTKRLLGENIDIESVNLSKDKIQVFYKSVE